MASGRDWWYALRAVAGLIATQLAGAGAGVAAALAVGGAGPARAAGGAPAGAAGVRWPVLVAIAAAAWLTWASLRHEFDLRWWSVLGPLLPAGILAGYAWRVLTTRVGAPAAAVRIARTALGS
jgi:hypothetical protein